MGDNGSFSPITVPSTTIDFCVIIGTAMGSARTATTESDNMTPISTEAGVNLWPVVVMANDVFFNPASGCVKAVYAGGAMTWDDYHSMAAVGTEEGSFNFSPQGNRVLHPVAVFVTAEDFKVRKIFGCHHMAAIGAELGGQVRVKGVNNGDIAGFLCPVAVAVTTEDF